MMGAGPFFRIPHIQLDELTYRRHRRHHRRKLTVRSLLTC
jgi:hypothetical protein